MKQNKSRSLEPARRKLHQRWRMMQFEHTEHARWAGNQSHADCITCRMSTSRLRLIEDIIREFGGRA